MDYCPSCQTYTINRSVCSRCQRDFHTNIFKKPHAERRRFPRDIPTAYEASPSKVPYTLRDNAWKQANAERLSHPWPIIRNRILRFS